MQKSKSAAFLPVRKKGTFLSFSGPAKRKKRACATKTFFSLFFNNSIAPTYKLINASIYANTIYPSQSTSLKMKPRSLPCIFRSQQRKHYFPLQITRTTKIRKLRHPSKTRKSHEQTPVNLRETTLLPGIKKKPSNIHRGPHD